MNLKSIISLISLIGILVITSCSHNVYISSSNLYGKWTGEGNFNNTNLNIEVGTVHFEIEINKDNIVTGTIGDSKIIKSKIVRHVTFKGKDGNTIKCKMEGKINSEVDFEGKKLDIIMYVEGKTEIRTNFFYGSRVGSIVLIKSEN